MKRIVLKGRTQFTLRDKNRKPVKTMMFEKGVAYEVSDEVANHKFIRERLEKVEAVEQKKAKAKKPEPKAEKEGKDVEPETADCGGV